MKRISQAALGFITTVLFVAPAFVAPALAGGKKDLAKAAIARILERDAARDATLAVTRTGQERFLYRYTTQSSARRAKLEGLREGSHFTTGIGPERALSAAEARARFGLPQRPDVRIKVRLPAGTRVKEGKALGGKAGYGEIVIDEPLPPASIVEIVPLR